MKMDWWMAKHVKSTPWQKPTFFCLSASCLSVYRQCLICNAVFHRLFSYKTKTQYSPHTERDSVLHVVLSNCSCFIIKFYFQYSFYRKLFSLNAFRLILPHCLANLFTLFVRSFIRSNVCVSVRAWSAAWVCRIIVYLLIFCLAKSFVLDF